MATSELNQFLENVDEMVLECTICFKRLQNPKSLNCLHTFCLACLEDWVRKEKGKLTCPTCSKSYSIPEGGLQKLPPNTISIETIDKFSETDQMKCVCRKGQAKCYCVECRHYLCSTCNDHHKILPISENHKLHSVEDMRSMTPLQIAALHPPMCSLHNEPLKFFCSICKIPICMHCTITDHNAWDGNHKPISISKAFQTFKETSATLEKAANECKTKLQNGLKKVIQNTSKLEQSKETSLRDFDNHVQEIHKKIMEIRKKVKNKVEAMYKVKKQVNDLQVDELKITISDINTKLRLLNQLLKSDEVTAMQSCESVITALKERIDKLPTTDPKTNGQFNFFINNDQFDSLQEWDIGYVSHMKVADNYFGIAEDKIYSESSDLITIGINEWNAQLNECRIYLDQLNATWTKPSGETCISEIVDDYGYWVLGKCTGPGIYELDVTADGEPISNSPLMIKVEEEGLVNTIQILNTPCDVVKCGDDSLLVSNLTNEMLKYKQSGEYVSKVTLPQGVKVYRMFKMKNGNIAFSDNGMKKRLKVCNMNGQVIKSMGKGELSHPTGIHVDEASNVVYVGDWNIGCVFMFDIDSGHVIKKITGSRGNQRRQLEGVIDVTLTNQGDLLVLEYGNSRLHLYDNAGRFKRVLVEAGNENGKLRNPCGVVFDNWTIIISSKHKVQLFRGDGDFIKRIDKKEDGINNPLGLSIISHHPQRFAVVNPSDENIKMFNYTDNLSQELVLFKI
ncbi:tripartite motif-containing protein 2-like [Anneissia japonica]|uniref:tripartite motif-containing protein 2-like n=1 Tax=Anneissia japonica TaxID=1529436 RepID=UPI0014257B22|nr:tripartite motif-containing protein 2-like [Anneissia japonica]